MRPAGLGKVNLTKAKTLGLVSMALAGCLVGGGVQAPIAGADPTCSNVPSCVPGLDMDAATGKRCTAKGVDHRYVFGVDSSYSNTGSTFICVNDYGTGTQVWTPVPPLYGVMRAGELCRRGWSAQNTDGRPMVCGDSGRWLVYLTDVA